MEQISKRSPGPFLPAFHHSNFEHNTCINAGGGFSMQGESPPRQSDPYPQPGGIICRVNGRVQFLLAERRPVPDREALQMAVRRLAHPLRAR